ncbi:MAG: N-succinylarginine dihydrolase [Phycisphaeraceae bacterium]|nr:N-succinylarginine dihydrolase [Phycisphaeraceae bacterium]
MPAILRSLRQWLPAHYTPRVPELNLDGIVGPTHNYAGLSLGNVASTLNQGVESHPRKAALQGLEKMAAVAALGIPQGVLPPHERPHVPTLRALGFTGSDADVVERAARDAPTLLACASSASAMWTANAATVTPSGDSGDGRVHFTPANLRSMFHRSIEPPTTTRALRAIFTDPSLFTVHDPLPSTGPFGDEGAANHTRLTPSAIAGGEVNGVHLFVYGAGLDPAAPRPRRFPARQDREASLAVVRRHGIAPDRVLLVQQTPEVIDEGVFHNDVIAVGNGHLLLAHEDAFLGGVDQVESALRERLGTALVVARVSRDELSVAEAVSTYLFNSQLLTCPDGSIVLVAPSECEAHPRARAVIDRLVADSRVPLSRAIFKDVRESMRNGGGPACLRLRVPLTEQELSRVNAGVRFTPEVHARLLEWIERSYPETLTPRELGDPRLLSHGRDALDALTRLLNLGPIYDFQRAG